MSRDINHIRNQIKRHFEKKKEDHKKTYISKKNLYWSKYYQDARWGRLRNAYYAAYPCCEVCDRQGIVTPTDEVHHLHPFGSAPTEEAKWSLLLNPNNLCSCCRRHHKMFHKYMNEKHLEHATINEILIYEQEQEELNSLINK